MKLFLRKVLLFIIVFFLVEKIFYFFILASPKLEADDRLERVINGQINKEIIIFGSSRGARNIIACQIEDSLDMSTYNLSYPGSNIEFHEFLLRALLKFNQKPELVILAVDDPGELLYEESLVFRLDRLYPLAKYKYINDEMIARGEKNFLSKVLVLLRINKRNFDLREKKFGTLDTIFSCGSMPVSFQRSDRDFKYLSSIENYPVDKELKSKRIAFQKFQDLCLENNILLLLVYSPNFRIHDNQFENRLRELTDSNVFHYVYDTTNNIYKDKNYFYDEGHLIKKGGIIFTNEIIDFIKTELFE